MVLLPDGEMKVYKGTVADTENDEPDDPDDPDSDPLASNQWASESNREEEIGKMSMDKGFIGADTFKVLTRDSKTPHMTIESQHFQKPGEYKNAMGKVVARQLSPELVQVGPGVDILKVMALFILQWWNWANECCGPAGNLAGGHPI